MGGLWLALLALLARRAGPAAALEGPLCRGPGNDCEAIGNVSSAKEFFFKIYGKQLNVVYDERENIFSVICDQGPRSQWEPALAADDPMLPAFESPTEVAHASFEGCRLPNMSYDDALRALNVIVTKKLGLLRLPAEARLTRQHLAGLSVRYFQLEAEQTLRPAPDFLAELPQLEWLWLYRVVAPRALPQLPANLSTLVLNEAALLAAERELRAAPEPALRDAATRWLARLPALQTLSLIEQDADEVGEAADARLTPPPLAALPRLTQATIRVPLGPLPQRWLIGSKLQTLNLVSCDISDLSTLPFEGATNLTILNISNNNLTFLPKDVFKWQHGLGELDVSRNRLSGWVLKRALLKVAALRVLKASGNPLGSLCGNCTIVCGNESSELPSTLRRLELRETGATRICYDWLNKAPELMTIDLQDNDIETLEFDDLVMLRNVSGAVQLRLEGNRLRELPVTKEQLDDCLDAATARPPADPAETTRALVELSLSKLHCNCSNARLRALLQACSQLLALAAGAGCSPDALRADAPEDFLGYEPDQLLCRYQDSCVPGCTCGAGRLSDNATVVSCAGPLPAAPRWPRSSAQWPLALRVAARAGLAAVPQGVALVELSAPYNNITELTDIPDTLRVLDLTHNNIARVSPAAAKKLRRLHEQVRLAGNPFACACADQPALALLRDANVKDKEDLRCGGDGPLLSDLQPDELCPSLLPPLAFSAVALVVLLAAGAALWHRGKPRLKQFLFQRQLCLGWVLGADDTVEDPAKTHDAFVSYAHPDHAKAAAVVRGLERRGYSTVLHCRDWMPGAAVAEHIARSVLCARRTLLLVSDDYGASKWALEEFRAAHAHALERRSARVLLVRCGLRAPERLPPDLQLHLRLNTYLDYGDAAFWDKLCRVMPPPRPAPAPAAPQDDKPSIAARFVTRAPPSLALPAAKRPRLSVPPRPRTPPAPPRELTPPPARAAQVAAAAKLCRLLSPPAAPLPPAPAAAHERSPAAQMELAPRAALATLAAPSAC